MGWVTGFWWARGRWEHDLWLQWVVLPSFALNADRIWPLWKEWFGHFGGGIHKNLWWFGLFSLIEWQFWVTGFRTGDWWGGAGSGKDFVVLTVIISTLALIGNSPPSRNRLWLSAVAMASLAVVVSLVLFYQQYAISEQRFRLVWRYEPGFNAVTTGILIGFALVAGWGPWARHDKIPAWVRYLVLLVLGFTLAASESRGALLAVVVAGAVHFAKGAFFEKSPFQLRVVPIHTLQSLLASFAGFLVYWFLALRMGQAGGGDLVNRGSAGRTDVYREYLSQLSVSDWIVGKGHVPSLPPEELGWVVHHPHSAYLGQLVGYGFLGTAVLGVVLVSALWKIRRTPELSLVVFGLVACLFDGGQIFTALSLARWETLVVLIPLVIAVSRTASARTRPAGSKNSS